MITMQLLTGWLLQGMLQSLVVGGAALMVITLLIQAFPKSAAASRFLIYSIAQLVVLLGFLQPFAEAGYQILAKPVIVTTVAAPAQRIITAVTAGGYTPSTDQSTSLQHVSPARDWSSLAGWILWCYAAGLLLFGLRFLHGYVGMLRLKTKGLRLPDGHWPAAFERVKTTLRIRRTIRLRFSNLVRSPCIVGWARAVVLIPVSLATKLSPDQAEAILLHELAHHRQLHHYFNIVAQIGAALQFFNPFVWLMMRSANKYREWSCDQVAVAHHAPHTLADSLLIVAQEAALHNPFVLALQRPHSPLFHRIQNLLYMKSNPVSSRGLLASFLLVGVTAWACIAHSGKKQKAINKIVAVEHHELPASMSTTTLPEQEAETAAPLGADNDPANSGAAAAAIRDSLQIISAAMQAESNFSFLIVEAIHDSLMHFNERINIAYVHDRIQIDGKPVPEPYGSRYLAMVKNLPLQQHFSYWSMRCDGIKPAEVYNEYSDFRRPEKPFNSVSEKDGVRSYQLGDESDSSKPVKRLERTVNKGGFHHTGIVEERLLKTIVATDGLADTSKRLSVVYYEKGIAVNGLLVGEALEAKYEQLLHDRFTDARPKGVPNSSYEVTYVPDGEKY